MASKNKGDGTGSFRGGWQKDEDELQAVVIADSFNRKFTPITFELPRALLPLGNRPLLDYTIEYLMEQGIQEIIIFCCSLGEKIRDYVNKKWVNHKKCNIHCVMSSTTDCISLGDAMREIDREGLIRSDFVLVPGDLVANIKLSDIIKEHKAKRKKEKTLVMTSLYRESNPDHYTRCPEDSVVMTLEDQSNRILQWQKMQNVSAISLSTRLLTKRKQVAIHYDLSTCHITICSPQVAPLFADNFDYQNLDDLVKGILINEEILGDQIHACVIKSGYATRASDLHMYNAISLDYLNGWIYPLTPSSIIRKRNNVFLEEGVQLGRNCTLDGSVLVGNNVIIGDNVEISKSVIGCNCKIGNNVKLKGSYVWDNVNIGDNASIVQTVVCSGAKLEKSVKLIDSVVSFNVVIGDGMNLPPLTRISCVDPGRDIGDYLENISLSDNAENPDQEYDTSVVGAEGKGYSWLHIEDDEENVIPSLAGNNYDSSSDEESSEDENSELEPPTPPNETSNLYQFHLEVVENLRHGITENIAHDNLALEINASKFKFNISITELCQTLMKALLEISLKDGNKSRQELVKNVDLMISSLHGLLLKYFNSSDTQMHGLTSAEAYFVETPNHSNIFATFLHKLYEKDILDESVILSWHKKPPVAEDILLQDGYEELRKDQNLHKFVTWLQEAEEEDSESEEESD